MPSEYAIGDHPAVMSEMARRAWAVEQAATVYVGASQRAGTDRSVLEIADGFLAYLETPIRSADDRLLAAARAWDGSQDAGALIGLLADALERMRRGG